MNSRLWLIALPADDPAFAPLRRVKVIDPEEYERVAAGHRQAVIDAARGCTLLSLEVAARRMESDARWHADELEAWGYQLGITAVRIALREHDEQAVAP